MSRRTARTLTIPSLESLEARVALSAAPAVNPVESLVTSRGGPMMGLIYTEYVNYVQSGSHGSFETAQSTKVPIVGTTMGVTLNFGSGNFLSNAADMQALGMTFTEGDASTGLIKGFVPITNLPSVAADTNLSTMAPVYYPSSVTLPGAGGPSASLTPVEDVAQKGGTALGSIYQEYLNYEQAGGTGTFSPAEANQILFNGTSVGIDIRTTAAQYFNMANDLLALGMEITAGTIDGQVGVIEGFLPVAQLPTVAVDASLVGMSPIYKPST